MYFLICAIFYIIAFIPALYNSIMDREAKNVIYFLLGSAIIILFWLGNI